MSPAPRVLYQSNSDYLSIKVDMASITCVQFFFILQATSSSFKQIYNCCHLKFRWVFSLCINNTYTSKKILPFFILFTIYFKQVKVSPNFLHFFFLVQWLWWGQPSTLYSLLIKEYCVNFTWIMCVGQAIYINSHAYIYVWHIS